MRLSEYMFNIIYLSVTFALLSRLHGSAERKRKSKKKEIKEVVRHSILTGKKIQNLNQGTLK